MRDFVDRVFQGSSHQLVMQALSEKKASPQELAEIRAMLEASES
ncbi:MAG: putative transcriptional regulator [Verrucomicrobiales bacterium]|jgi:predicted transcriptional regulator